jgi:AhpD family alkylhydroperoxidase
MKGSASMERFKKRTYRSLREFMSDLSFIFKNRKRVRALFRGETISPAFRERMMLAVTRVNECRYCARFHAKAALAEGVSREEVEAILEGAFRDCPSDQLTGVLYAEHWAEMSGVPDAEVCGKLTAVYGQDTANDIDVVLRVVLTGNLTGNTVDYLLYRISFGKWGLSRTARSLP